MHWDSNTHTHTHTNKQTKKKLYQPKAHRMQRAGEVEGDRGREQAAIHTRVIITSKRPALHPRGLPALLKQRKKKKKKKKKKEPQAP